MRRLPPDSLGHGVPGQSPRHTVPSELRRDDAHYGIGVAELAGAMLRRGWLGAWFVRVGILAEACRDTVRHVPAHRFGASDYASPQNWRARLFWALAAGSDEMLVTFTGADRAPPTGLLTYQLLMAALPVPKVLGLIAVWAW